MNAAWSLVAVLGALMLYGVLQDSLVTHESGAAVGAVLGVVLTTSPPWT